MKALLLVLVLVGCGPVKGGDDGGTPDDGTPVHVSISYYSFNPGDDAHCQSGSVSQCSIEGDLTQTEIEAADFEAAGCTVSGGSKNISVVCPESCTSSSEQCGLGRVTTYACTTPPHADPHACSWTP